MLNGCAVLETFWIVFWRGTGKLMRVLDEVKQFWDRVQLWTSFHASSSMQNSIVKYSTPFSCWFLSCGVLSEFPRAFYLLLFLNESISQQKYNQEKTEPSCKRNINSVASAPISTNMSSIKKFPTLFKLLRHETQVAELSIRTWPVNVKVVCPNLTTSTLPFQKLETQFSHYLLSTKVIRHSSS